MEVSIDHKILSSLGTASTHTSSPLRKNITASRPLPRRVLVPCSLLDCRETKDGKVAAEKAKKTNQYIPPAFSHYHTSTWLLKQPPTHCKPCNIATSGNGDDAVAPTSSTLWTQTLLLLRRKITPTPQQEQVSCSLNTTTAFTTQDRSVSFSSWTKPETTHYCDWTLWRMRIVLA